MEKPFGVDLASARELNERVHAVFDEEQKFRIDHFLGKEAAQNILALRFANGLFEPIWNRESSRLSLSFYGKRPGPGMRLDKVSMQFSLAEVEHSDDSPDSWGPEEIHRLISPHAWRLPFERRWRKATRV